MPRWRLSVFAQEEAAAITVYLRHKQAVDIEKIHTQAIEAALQSYWLDRVENAPSTGELAEHLTEEARYLAAISSNFDEAS
jgi:hypothetical protein